jgi:replication-associated recombination protein RarA
MENYMIPDTKLDMLNAKFWTSKLHDGDRIIMNLDEIESFNLRNVEKVSEVYNLRSYNEKLTKEELKTFIQEYSIPEKVRYDAEGIEIQKEFYESLIENTNIDAISEVNDVKYGITVKNTSLRSFPTLKGIFNKADDIEFDRFQETGCQAVELV